MVEQTKLAFDFVQKLYLEVSYLIKEIEGLLAEEDERFLIGRGGGYSITARSSNGIEASNVHLWLMRTFSVFFVPEEMTKTISGVTITKFIEGLKTILVKVVMDETNGVEPYILIGTLYEITNKKERYEKFENLITHIEYNQNKIFSQDNTIDYEDAYFKFKGNFFRVNLYDVNSSEEIRQLIIKPVLHIFRLL